jgi:predicted anti-sigma-YlaC factor YlaD
MDCPACSEKLIDALAGRLDEAERSALAAHLAGCASCRAFEADARRHAALLAGDAPAALPAGAWERLERTLRDRRRRWILRAAAAALLAVGLPAALWTLRSGPAPMQIEVVDGSPTADPLLWISVLTDHAENDGVPVTPPIPEEEP